MMNKFWFLTGNSIKKKIVSKWFIVINVILCLGIVAIVNIDSIIKAFGGDFNETNEILVIDNSGYFDVFKSNLETYNKQLDMGMKFDIKKDTNTYEKSVEELKDSDKVLVVLDSNKDEYLEVKVVSETTIDTVYYQLLYQALSTTKSQVAFNLTDIDKEELEKITGSLKLDRIILDENKTSEDENMETIMSTVFPTLTLPVFLLVVFLVQMIGAEINEEKQTRSMEVIISNVSPKAHFFSKVVASNGFVLIQGALLLIYGGLSLLIKSMSHVGTQSSITKEIGNIWNMLVDSGFVAKLPVLIPAALVLMILSFLAYSLLAGVLASMTVSMEDYQQIQTPIMMICLLGYYLALMAGMFDGSLLIRFLSYVPYISCLLSPALLVIGQISLIDVIISAVVLIVFDGLLIKYGLRIYKIGILNYSTDKMWSKIFKAVKTKEV